MDEKHLLNREMIRVRLSEEQQRLMSLTTKVRTRLKEEQKSINYEVSDSADGAEGVGMARDGSEVDVSVGYVLDERFQQIAEALNKLDNGTYGFCESCGGEIPAERLEALPEATLCVKCQQDQERKRVHGERIYERIED